MFNEAHVWAHVFLGTSTSSWEILRPETMVLSVKYFGSRSDLFKSLGGREEIPSMNW